MFVSLPHSLSAFPFASAFALATFHLHRPRSHPPPPLAAASPLRRSHVTPPYSLPPLLPVVAPCTPTLQPGDGQERPRQRDQEAAHHPAALHAPPHQGRRGEGPPPQEGGESRRGEETFIRRRDSFSHSSSCFFVVLFFPLPSFSLLPSSLLCVYFSPSKCSRFSAWLFLCVGPPRWPPSGFL